LPHLIFFGHDAHDAAVQRRIASFARAGAEVTGFTMRRGEAFTPPWRNVDLGLTRDAAFAQRLAALARARGVLRQHKETLAAADIFYARNLDMLLLATQAKSMSGARAQIVYECLDIHRFMTRADALGAAMRGLERRLLKATARVIISSPAFERAYFAKRHSGAYRAELIENRMPPGFAYGPRPGAARAPDGVVAIGWFGNLRCKRSLALLLALAARFPDRVRLKLRGAPAKAEFADFEARVEGRANVRFEGRYRWPDDLAAIYQDVDLVWAGDFHDAGANSKWLLPNRLYEGGYYGAPPLAPADSETGRWIDAHGFGFTLAEPLEETLQHFIETLTPTRIGEARARLMAAPDSVFLQDDAEIPALLASLLKERGA
jgi:succinoglycan biosynthesis protein ExoL